METIASRLARLRESKAIRQEDVANAVGVSRVAVTKWESGQTANIKLANLSALCKLFDVSYDYLINGKEEVDDYAPPHASGGHAPAMTVQQKVAKFEPSPRHRQIEEIVSLAQAMSEPGQWELLGHARLLATMYPRTKANPAN